MEDPPEELNIRKAAEEFIFSLLPICTIGRIAEFCTKQSPARAECLNVRMPSALRMSGFDNFADV